MLKYYMFPSTSDGALYRALRNVLKDELFAAVELFDTDGLDLIPSLLEQGDVLLDISGLTAKLTSGEYLHTAAVLKELYR